MPIHQHFILQGYFCVTKTAAKVLLFFDICKYFPIILYFSCFFYASINALYAHLIHKIRFIRQKKSPNACIYAKIVVPLHS